MPLTFGGCNWYMQMPGVSAGVSDTGGRRSRTVGVEVDKDVSEGPVVFGCGPG